MPKFQGMKAKISLYGFCFLDLLDMTELSTVTQVWVQFSWISAQAHSQMWYWFSTAVQLSSFFFFFCQQKCFQSRCRIFVHPRKTMVFLISERIRFWMNHMSQWFNNPLIKNVCIQKRILIAFLWEFLIHSMAMIWLKMNKQILYLDTISFILPPHHIPGSIQIFDCLTLTNRHKLWMSQEIKTKISETGFFYKKVTVQCDH